MDELTRYKPEIAVRKPSCEDQSSSFEVLANNSKQRSSKLENGLFSRNLESDLKMDNDSDGSDDEDSWVDEIEECRLEKLGSQGKNTISQKDLLKLAPRFSKNIVISSKPQSKKPQCEKKRKREHKYRYYNIYKNLMRDIKAYFKEKLNAMIEKQQCEIRSQQRVKKNFYLSKVMLPIQ